MKVCDIFISGQSTMNHPLERYFSLSSDDDVFQIEDIGLRPRIFCSRINLQSDPIAQRTPYIAFVSPIITLPTLIKELDRHWNTQQGEIMLYNLRNIFEWHCDICQQAEISV